MEIELQKINNIVIISNDTVIGNESAGMKKVSPRRQQFSYQIVKSHAVKILESGPNWTWLFHDEPFNE